MAKNRASSKEETETHFFKKFTNGTFKTLELEIANLALLIPCMEFEKFWVQIPSFEVFIQAIECILSSHLFAFSNGLG